MNRNTTTMKTLFFIWAFATASIFTVNAQEKEAVTLTIDVTVTKHHKGAIFLALYDKEESYMHESYKSGHSEVKDGKVSFVFKDVEKGDYAFSLFHDLNSNKKLDTNFFGIPKEPYGFSNEKKGRFGPPKFKDVKFHLNESTTINVSIK